MEKEISVEKLYELYIDTLDHCGLFLLQKSDKEIGYDLFEEFDVGATSFLHEKSLIKLQEHGLISAEIRKQSEELRKKYYAIEQSAEYNIQHVRTSEKWRNILKSADEIKKQLKRKNL